MIKIERVGIEAKLKMEGPLPMLCSELEAILRVFREMAESKLGEDGAEELINQIFDDSKCSEEEFNKSNKEFIKNKIKEGIEDNAEFKEALDNLYDVINRNFNK